MYFYNNESRMKKVFINSFVSSFYTYFTIVPGYNAMLINTKEKCRRNLGDNQLGISIANSDLETCAESCNNNDQCMFFFTGGGWCELLKSCSILDTNRNQVGSTYQKIVPGISKQGFSENIYIFLSTEIMKKLDNQSTNFYIQILLRVLDMLEDGVLPILRRAIVWQNVVGLKMREFCFVCGHQAGLLAST